MPEETNARPPRVETNREKDRRYQHLLFAGAPIPAGWKLPHLSDPPARSDPEALWRADGKVESVKAARFESWRRVPFDAGVAVEPGQGGRWSDVTEFGKLDLMQHWVGWQGVGRADRAGMMTAQLDLEKLSPVLREQLRNDAHADAERADRLGVFEVWHATGFPESRLAQVLGGAEVPFPDDFARVARVSAEGLAQAVRLTRDGGDLLDPEPWTANPGVEVRVFAPRSTADGDVIVNPAGKAIRVEGQGFEAIEATPRQTRSPSEIAQVRGPQGEDRADGPGDDKSRDR